MRAKQRSNEQKKHTICFLPIVTASTFVSNAVSYDAAQILTLVIDATRTWESWKRNHDPKNVTQTNTIHTHAPDPIEVPVENRREMVGRVKESRFGKTNTALNTGREWYETNTSCFMESTGMKFTQNENQIPKQGFCQLKEHVNVEILNMRNLVSREAFVLQICFPFCTLGNKLIVFCHQTTAQRWVWNSESTTAQVFISSIETHVTGALSGYGELGHIRLAATGKHRDENSSPKNNVVFPAMLEALAVSSSAQERLIVVYFWCVFHNSYENGRRSRFSPSRLVPKPPIGIQFEKHVRSWPAWPINIA